MEVRVEGLLDLGEEVESSLPSSLSGSSSWVVVPVPAVRVGERPVVLSRGQEVEVAADDDEVAGWGLVHVAGISFDAVSDALDHGRGEPEVVYVVVNPSVGGIRVGDPQDAPRDDLFADEVLQTYTGGLRDESEDSALILLEATLVVSRREGVEGEEVLVEGVQEPSELLRGAVDLLQGDDRAGPGHLWHEGLKEPELAHPGMGPMMIQSSGVPSAEADSGGSRDPGGQECATQTTGRQQQAVRWCCEPGSSRGSSPCRSQH